MLRMFMLPVLALLLPCQGCSRPQSAADAREYGSPSPESLCIDVVGHTPHEGRYWIPEGTDITQLFDVHPSIIRQDLPPALNRVRVLRRFPDGSSITRVFNIPFAQEKGLRVFTLQSNDTVVLSSGVP